MKRSKYITAISGRAISRSVVCLCIGFCFFVFKIKAQAVFTTAGTYTQDFGTVTQPSWSDNTTYLGWYALSYQISTPGTDPYRGTTNIQTAIVPPNPGGWSVYQCNSGTDMKLGTRPSNSSGGPDVPGLDGRRGIGLGLCLQNTLSSAIASIKVDFDWYQLSLAENGNEPNNFFFSYFISASNLAGADLPNNAHAYTNVPAANYSVPNSTSSCCSNQLISYPCNVTGHISVCIPLNVPVNSYIMLRWWDPNNASNDHHSAIDNVNITAYSDNSCLVVLPVELVSFEAKDQFDKVELSWITASERNNDYFTVERSEDGITFERITTVKAIGDSKKMISYKTYDHSPSSSDIVYYRLKQTDLDGSFSYFNMIVLDKLNLKVTDLKIMPNPSESGLFTLSFNGNRVSENFLIEIFDHTGVKITEVKVKENSFVIDLSTYAKGMYFVKVDINGKIITRKVVYR